MKLIETELKGCFVVEPTVFGDSRGYFFESFNEKKFQAEIGHPIHFVQDNQSFSTYGVLRGLHAQRGNSAQAKLVRVLQGEILDIAVDVRSNSKTFGKYSSVLLSAENKKQLFIPKGFLHGFVVLSDTAEVFYKCDNAYDKESEVGARFDDPAFGIDWKLPKEALIISEKDELHPPFTAENWF